MLAENYKAKIVQHVKKIDYNERLNIARKYNYNLHKAPSEFFILDFYNCPNALSEEQYSASFRGDESYAGSENFINMIRICLNLLFKTLNFDLSKKALLVVYIKNL